LKTNLLVILLSKINFHMKNIAFVILFLAISAGSVYSQASRNYTMIVRTGIESRELLDLLSFEDIGYLKIKITGKDIKGMFYRITSNEYWNKELTKSDTIIDTKKFSLKNDSDTLNFRIISKKFNSDTVKFQIFQPRLASLRKFKTTPQNTYSLRDPSNGKNINFQNKDKITFLSYSLPYEDPAMPGYLFYCALSSDGVHPRDWGNKYGVKHYITFDIEIFD
jgi:hypothetical protein